MSRENKKITNKFKREGSESNTQVGRDFEDIAQKYCLDIKITLEKGKKVPLGLPGRERKEHAFDLGNESILVECKSHKWTSGDNVPSAKMTVWNEAMYYFSLVPAKYKKYMFVLKDVSEKKGFSLMEYYIEKFNHLIPEGVIFFEYDENNKSAIERTIQ
jgi:hypothetical protein